MAENEEELKTLDESKTGAGKSWLKTQNSKNKYYGIWSHHFMQIYGEIMEIVKDFIFLGSKITEDSDHSHEIKRCLLLGRKAITNLGSVLKSTDITLSTKVHIFKAMVFPVAMYGYESWTKKKAEHRRINVSELRCWRRLLSSLDHKEIQPVNPEVNQP